MTTAGHRLQNSGFIHLFVVVFIAPLHQLCFNCLFMLSISPSDVTYINIKCWNSSHQAPGDFPGLFLQLEGFASFASK